MLETINLAHNDIGTLAYKLIGQTSNFRLMGTSDGERSRTLRVSDVPDPEVTPEWVDGSCWPLLKSVDPYGRGFFPCRTMEHDAQADLY